MVQELDKNGTQVFFDFLTAIFWKNNPAVFDPYQIADEDATRVQT